MEEDKMNEPLVWILLDRLDKQLTELQASLDEMRKTLDNKVVVDRTWSEEEEAQYRMRHSS